MRRMAHLLYNKYNFEEKAHEINIDILSVRPIK